MIYVVTYVYPADREDDLAQVRPAHREFLANLHARGDLLASGPWVGDAPGAYLLMKTDSGAAALDVLADDPFHQAGLLDERSVQGWNPVIGSLASAG